MSEQQSQPHRPTSDDREAWKAYWTAQGMPWRTEPEIDVERQQFLAERRAVKPDIQKGIYPFREEQGSIMLTRADVEWLLATHESRGSRGPVDWNDEKQWTRDGLDLRGAVLQREDLQTLPLARLCGGLRLEERATTAAWQDDAAAVHLPECHLGDTHLEGANLSSAHLEGCLLVQAHVEEADLSGAHLETAVVRASHLERARLEGAHLEGAVLDGGTHLEGASLTYAKCDANTVFANVQLSSPKFGTALLVNVVWGDATVAGVDWSQLAITGEERVARHPDRPPLPTLPAATLTLPRVVLFQFAVRANRQLALALRAQGINEWADHFAYRAQVLQREVLRRQRRFLRYGGSALLDLISGYGYQPLRSVLTYLLVVAVFGLGYWALGLATGHMLTWNEAGVVSLTAFHGRGFFATAFQPGDPQAAVAAIEAVFGLLIEITFIATFTQRFFAR